MVGTGRGVGVTELLHGSTGEAALVGAALLTQLGDVWFLFLLAGVLYVAGDRLPRWGIDRRRALFVLGLALTYVGLVGLLKGTFLLPRPPGAAEAPAVRWLPSALTGVFEHASTAEGPGFPSGHALGTTMVWGGLALVLVEDGHSPAWFGVAAGVVAVVSVTRLVLGVHYLVDVLVGVGLGVVALGGLYLLADRGTDPSRVLAVAVAVGAAGLLQGVTFDSVAAVGSALGAWLLWRGAAASTPAHPTDRRVVLAGFAVVGLAGALFALVYALEPAPLPTFLGTAVVGAGTVAAPLLGERLGGG